MFLYFRFGLNDIIMPEPKRLRYFLGHFINYWLFCSNYYDLYTEQLNGVDEHANQRIKMEEKIKEYQRQNEELKMKKASSQMKSQKLKAKIDHDKSKLAKLTEDVNALTQETHSVKEKLNQVKQTENQLTKETEELEKTEIRLKSISKADEIKHELEEKIGKFYFLKNLFYFVEKN